MNKLKIALCILSFVFLISCGNDSYQKYYQWRLDIHQNINGKKIVNSINLNLKDKEKSTQLIEDSIRPLFHHPGSYITLTGYCFSTNPLYPQLTDGKFPYVLKNSKRGESGYGFHLHLNSLCSTLCDSLLSYVKAAEKASKQK